MRERADLYAAQPFAARRIESDLSGLLFYNSKSGASGRSSAQSRVKPGGGSDPEECSSFNRRHTPANYSFVTSKNN